MLLLLLLLFIIRCYFRFCRLFFFVSIVFPSWSADFCFSGFDSLSVLNFELSIGKSSEKKWMLLSTKVVEILDLDCIKMCYVYPQTCLGVMAEDRVEVVSLAFFYLTFFFFFFYAFPASQISRRDQNKSVVFSFSS
ncbi:hypothetical protein RND81_03G118100 [Saponaria officinalis]|uniref:Uncharacterized protein n=1 Tax=Saponaria officinalis TaxID=3572 RepID=A0AAW1LZP7_SAPOF